jgi:hypothetical protein
MKPLLSLVAALPLSGKLDPATGLLADSTPPFALYPANLNQVGPFGNPFLGLP